MKKNIKKSNTLALKVTANENLLQESVRPSSPLPKERESLIPLTPKEQSVLQFIEGYILSFGFSPSYQEIKDNFNLASFNSVQNYLKQLTQKKYISNPLNQKRAIQVLMSSSAHSDNLKSVSTAGSLRTPLLQSNDEILSLPLLGKVAAGQPLEAYKHDELLSVPAHMIKNASKSFALLVQGDSMIDEGILDGDFLLVEERTHAHSGDIIVASIENEATVKRIYYNSAKNSAPSKNENGKLIELRPSNKNLKSMWFDEADVSIRGKVIGLIRKY